MSSLQAQLAAAGGGNNGRQPGLTFPLTQNHDAAMGRGGDYSVRHGTPIHNNEGQASVMYDSARQAAKVPLATIQEHCDNALNQLAERYPALHQHGTGLMAPAPAAGAAPPALLQQILYAMTSVLGDETSREYCLQVLEYMLRRYRVHQSMPDALLWTVLPHHHVLPALVHRVLQLLDLGANNTYLWLRPYARAHNNNKSAAAVMITPVPRALIAQHVVQSPAVLRQLCTVAEHVAQQHNQPDDYQHGATRVLSWTATVLVQGLTTIAHFDDDEQREATVRTILPTMLVACRERQYMVWMRWGHVVASVLAEQLELAEPTVTKITLAMLANITDRTLLEHQADVVTAVLAVVMPTGQPDNERHVTRERYLTVPTLSSSSASLPVLLLGCELPDATGQTLLDWPDLSRVLGVLHAERQLVVAPLVATLIAAAVRSHRVAVVHRLLESAQLVTLWKGSSAAAANLIAATVAQLVLVLSQGEVDQSQTKGLLGVMELLHAMDAHQCEHGLAWAMSDMSDERRALVHELLASMIVPHKHAADDSCSVNVQLPPRVALEHVQAAVRGAAIRQLQAGPVETLNETDIERLLRRWSADDDVTVAMDAIALVAKMVANDNGSIVESMSPLQCKNLSNLVWHGCKRWRKSQLWITKLLKPITMVASRFVLALKQIIPLDDGALRFKLQCVPIAHLDDENVDQGAMQHALELVWPSIDDRTREPSEEKSFTTTIGSILALDRPYVEWLAQSLSDGHLNPDDEYFCRKCCWVLIGRSSGNTSNENIDSLLDLAVIALRLGEGLPDNVGIVEKLISGAMGKATIEQIPGMLIKAAEVVALQTYEDALDLQSLASCSKTTVRNASLLPSMLVEAALRADNGHAAELLVETAGTFIASSRDPYDGLFVLLPILLMLQSEAKMLRRATAKCLEILSARIFERKGSKENKLQAIGRFCGALGDSALKEYVDSRAPLPLMLERHIAPCTGDQGELAIALLEIATATALGSDYCKWENGTLKLSEGRLPVACRRASLKACASFLTASAAAGEDVFPLHIRWQVVGEPLLRTFLALDQAQALPCKDVADAVVQMMRGVVVSEPVTQITVRAGKRTRSYSVETSFGGLDPYPESMKHLLVNTLRVATSHTCARDLCVLIEKNLLGDPFWRSTIWSVFDLETRGQFLEAAFHSVTTAEPVITPGTIAQLPITTTFACATINSAITGSPSMMVLWCSSVIVSAKSLCNDPNVVELLEEIFSAFQSWGTTESFTSDTFEWLCEELVTVASTLLNELVNGGHASGMVRRHWSNALEGLLPPVHVQSDVVLSQKAYRRVLALLSTLYQVNRKSAGERVLSVFETQIKPATDRADESAARALFQVLLAPNLFEIIGQDGHLARLAKCLSLHILQPKREKFSVCIMNLFVTTCREHVTDEPICAGAVTAVLMVIATDQGSSDSRENASNVVCPVLQCAGSEPRWSLRILSMFVQCLLCTARRHGAVSAESGDLPCHQEGSLCSGVLTDKLGANGAAMTFVAQTLVDSLRDASFTAHTETLTENNDVADVYIRLWQYLLHINSLIASNLEGFPEGFHAKVEAAVELVDSRMPSTLYVASVTSILIGPSSDSIITHALRQVAKRFSAGKMVADDAWLPLFLEDLVPRIECLIPQNTVAIAPSARVQAVLVSLEAVAQCCPRQQSNVFEKSFQYCVRVLQESTVSMKNKVDTDMIKFASYAAILARTIVLTSHTGVADIDQLVRSCVSLIKALIVNANQTDDSLVMQCAVIRAVSAAAISQPKYLIPLASRLFATDALFSVALRSIENSMISFEMDALDSHLAAALPLRTLVPAMAGAVGCDTPLESLQAMFRILKRSIQESHAAEVASQRKLILKATLAFAGQRNDVQFENGLDDASSLFLALALKLSEAQLKQVIVDMITWMNTDENISVERKQVFFWRVSSVLACELNTLFLPCLSLSIDTALTTLASAVSSRLHELGSPRMSKRRRLTEGNQSVRNASAHRVVQAILPCLSNALGADASSGGMWTRADDNKRFNLLLEPLVGLLRHPDLDGHIRLANGSTGSAVVSCITSLASASGNEASWKSLNHGILQVCGHENSKDVRKLGISCLLSLVKTLGEEYMVLIPECLPVLAELMEDRHDTIASMARETIDLAEEMIGESLEECVR